ncbi:MAG: uracil phosphoribosyltransferase [Acidimicrobiia bacterium]|nr:uracil phosphoribosyltransferase [Acidimicrobiia bacterium]
MSVTELDHPLAKDLLTSLRDRDTESPRFREYAHRLGLLLVAEALTDIEVEETKVQTPLEGGTGYRLGKPVVAVAVLRAGLGLLDSLLTLVPDAAIGFAGLQRDEETAEPIEYYSKFPEMGGARVLVLEPMLATGGSLSWAITMTKQRGATDITAVTVVSAPQGLEVIERDHPDIRVVTGSVDDDLDHNFYIRPGLGDMGDRLFGT